MHKSRTLPILAIGQSMTLPDLNISNLSYFDMAHAVLNPLLPQVPRGEKASVALFDFPYYSNVGDSAIWLGMESYLKKQSRIRTVAVTSHQIGQLPNLPEQAVILINGGGNLGDLWPRHQLFREKVITHYRHHRIIQLPQSIHFQEAKNQARCRNIFNRHPDFHLLVRDRDSLAQGQNLHDGSTQLCPDMALCLEHLPRSTEPSHPLIGLLRTDKERVTAELAPESAGELLVYDWLEEPVSLIRQITMQVESLQNNYPRWTIHLYGLKRHLYYRLAMQRLQHGCDILCSGHVAITDRLHGHILCNLMGIPHVVLDNSYRKISNFRDVWRTGHGFCEAATTLEEAVFKAQSLLDNIQ